MKTILSSLLWLVLNSPGTSSNVWFDVQGMYTRPIQMEKLNNAKTMSDFCTGYPGSWISEYYSSEISTTVGGKLLRATGRNEVLNAGQQSLLQSAGLGSDIRINIRYKFINPVTGEASPQSMDFLVTVVPEKEAEFAEGKEKLNAYLMENAIGKIQEGDTQRNKVQVRFTVNENGTISNACLFTRSGDPSMDSMLLEAIEKMPKWKPAEDENGVKVKQEFQFNVDAGGGC